MSQNESLFNSEYFYRIFLNVPNSAPRSLTSLQLVMRNSVRRTTINHLVDPCLRKVKSWSPYCCAIEFLSITIKRREKLESMAC
jgi:hypothetical protein